MSPLSNSNSDFNQKRPSPSKNLREAFRESKRRKVHGGSRTSSTSLYSFGSDLIDQENPSSKQISERIRKLEQLFEKFVCRKSSVTGAFATARGRNKNERKFDLPVLASDKQSISSIGDRILCTQTRTLAPSICTPVENKDEEYNSDLDHVHHSLTALLPSQHDADIVFESSNSWMILDGIYHASHNIYVDRDPQSYALDMQAVSQERSIIVARTLLHLAICIHSLPAEFDPSQLSSMRDLSATMENYVAKVTSLVTSSDEQMMTLHGLETLLLLALYHMNSASLRHSWLVVRRSLNLAQLMGFQHISTQEGFSPSIPAVSNGKLIWCWLVDLDRYLSIHLRLPFGAEDYSIPEDSEIDHAHRAYLNSIAQQVADLDRDVSPQAYSAALALDERLELHMTEMPKDFWEVPNISSTAKSPESYAVFQRLMVQMWHFELKILIHLPYLLRAPLESRYDFSRVAALQASRNVLMRWFALRNSNMTQSCCRFGEIGMFIAAVTLTLDIIIEVHAKKKCEVLKTKSTDFTMLCRLVGELEKLAKASAREKMAARSVVVLKKMLSSLDPNKQPAGKARLTMPFFGTVELEFKQLPTRPCFDVDSDACKLMNATASGDHLPVFSFVHSSLWPQGGDGLGCGFSWDIVLFDGLQDQDTEGNWVF